LDLEQQKIERVWNLEKALALVVSTEKILAAD
jgi:hypothetical protein